MQTQLLIGGEWLDGSGGDRIEVENPATEDVVTTVAAGTPGGCHGGVRRGGGRPAGLGRDGTAGAQRDPAGVLADASSTTPTSWPTLITTEHGKPLADARAEVAYSAEFFRWNAEEAVRIHGSLGTAPSGANRIIVHHPPVGVVVIVTPWNFPAAMITRKLAPALAAGNAVVIKPPALTPLTALRIGELLHGAGVPDGVVNIVPTIVVGRLVRRRRRPSGDAHGVVHRLDRGRHHAAEAGRRSGAEERDGAGRQRAVHRVRRRRHRRRRRGGDGRQDAPLRRDVHGGQPLLRARRRRRRVHDEVRGGDGCDQDRQRDGRGRHVRPDDQRRRRSTRSTSWSAAPSTAGATVAVGGHAWHGCRATSTSRPCWPTSTADAEITGHEIFGPVAPIIRSTTPTR